MKQGFYKYILIAAVFALPSALQAGDDIYINICNDTKYLKCMDINTKDCLAANTKAKNTCASKYPYKPHLDRDELIVKAKNYGYCTTEHYISNLGSDNVKFAQCSAYLEHIYDKELNDMRKESEAFDKKFFEEDDPLHNYSN